MYKTGSVPININTNPINGRSTNIQFMTQDTGSAKLLFSFTKDGVPLPLSAVDAKIVLLYDDGSFYKKSLTITDKVNGTAEYVLSNEELKHYGTVKAEIKLYYTNGQALATSFFTFSIAKTLEDQNIVPTADYYIDDFETLRDGINHIVEEISQTIEELQKKFADLEAIETKEGAQEKADAVQANLDKHSNDTRIHVTKSKQEIWDAAQLFKLTDNDGNSKTITGTNLDDIKTSGLYYISVQHTENKPAKYGQLIVLQRTRGTSPTFVQVFIDTVGEGTPTYVRSFSTEGVWSEWSQIETVTGAQAKVDTHANNEDIHVTKSFKDKLLELSQQFTTAFKDKLDELLRQFTAHNYNQERHISAAERKTWNGAATYANIMLKNGATAGTRTPIYAKWGPLILLRGHVRTEPEIIFGSIPAEYVPAGGGVYSVPLSGTGGTANLIIYDNGDLKIKYPDPADSGKMGGGYYLDVVVGFQEGGTA